MDAAEVLELGGYEAGREQAGALLLSRNQSNDAKCQL